MKIFFNTLLVKPTSNISSKDLSEDSELRQLAASREEIKVIQLGRGLRLIVRDESEILVP